MKKIVLTYGILAGIIVSAWITFALGSGIEHMDTERGMFLGFTAMIVAFSFIFVAVKNYRDKLNGGVISFGKAFRIGLYISLIASTLYVITWLILYNFVIPDFMEKYAAQVLEEMRRDGVPAAEIAEESHKMAEFRVMYQNPLVNMLFTYTEILPVGLLISTVVALIMKRKSPAVTA